MGLVASVVASITLSSPATPMTAENRALLKTLRVSVRAHIVVNDFAGAESYACRAVKVAARNNPISEETLTWMHEVAQLQDMQENYMCAEQTYASELAGRQKLYGENHPQLEHSWGDIAQNLEHQRKFAQAYEARLHQLAILESIFGPGNFALAQVNMDLGRVAYKGGKLAESIARYDTAISMLQKDVVANRVMIAEAERERARSSSKLAVTPGTESL